MVLSKLGKLLDSNERELKKLQPLVEKINSLDGSIKNLSDAKLKAKTGEFKKRLEKGETIDSILPEAFACVREVSRRTTGMRHFDVQLMAGVVLHQGKIAEQKTGEGKTLSATLPLYLNALAGRGVHLVTVNDYLSRRDAEWMGPIFSFLGLSVGVLNHEKTYIYDPKAEETRRVEETETPEELALGRGKFLREVPRRLAYEADITYGTNHEFGFDYLRDNMVYNTGNIVQVNPKGEEGAHNFAIVDEVDSLLIDEARTPLIISAPAEESTQKYYEFSRLVENLQPTTDYTVDEKTRSVSLTEIGINKLEKMLGVDNLYEKDFESVKHVEQALRAKVVFHKDKDYVVKDGEVIIVDEFTGRLMPGRRYSEGLHQAIEAKEGVEVKRESKTLATISFQNYFRMYEKLAGMTGTAATEAEEFHKIYKLDVVIIPTNERMIRVDHGDVIYKTLRGKYQAVVDEIEQFNKRGQPVLVGTTSIEHNELVSDLLKRKKISHELLNAKHHEKEAQILSKAGERGAVTVATNMAGRGVDIKLGEGVVELGGLHVIGTERHESRRIDNQLRGRSGRQGDPGSSRFFVSLQDELMRRFGGEQLERIMDKFGFDENVPISAAMVTRSIENAQKKVEGYNFDIRKHLVEYDDVTNKHREIIYSIRRRILEGAGRGDSGEPARRPVRQSFSVGESPELVEGRRREFREWYLSRIIPYIENVDSFLEKWVEHEERLKEVWYEFLKQLSLQTLDFLWIDHITTMTELREGIGLRGYAGKDPLVEYKKEARELFERLVNEIWASLADRISRVEVEEGPRTPTVEMSQKAGVEKHPESAVLPLSPLPPEALAKGGQSPQSGKAKKVGRNDPCPCGATKPDGRPVKYKHCHGR